MILRSKFCEKTLRTSALMLLLSTPYYSNAQDLVEKKYPIHEAIAKKLPVRGVYATVGDFVTNNPSIRDSIVTRESPREEEIWQGTTATKPYYTKNLKPIKKVWGFSDGTQCYISFGDEYFAIELEGNNFIFYGYGLPDSDAVSTAAVAGGMIGGGIAAAAQASKARKKKIKYLIYPTIGTYMALPSEEEMYLRQNPVELVVYRRSRKEKATNAEFLAHDSLVYSFQVDSYVMLRYPKSDSIAKLCVGPDFTDCISVPLSNDKVNYVEINLPEQAELPRIIIQEEDQGEFDFAKIEGNQDRRGRQEPQIRDLAK